MTAFHQINVHAETNRFAGAEVLAILESLEPLKFNYLPPNVSLTANESPNGDVIFRSESNALNSHSSLRLPGRAVAQNDGDLIEVVAHFESGLHVPFPFRSRSLRTKVPAGVKPLVPAGNEKILASTEKGPFWLVTEASGLKNYRSAYPLPTIPEGSNLPDVLSGERFLELLPLLQWIREVYGDKLLAGPPLRAGFIIDDPNLHWSRYGFVDYQQIATQAAKANYHVSFATIPLDTWFTHRATAEIFHRQVSRLSLCVHGNNHTKKELAQNYTQPARVALLHQAEQRIARLESRTGLKVSRVMIPPHGACAHDMLQAIPECGFEAACISHGSLRAHNKTRPWTKNLGLLPAELIQGCPVLPRWSFTGNVTSTILLAAFLHQPIILRGHHQDLKNGIEILSQVAGIINSLGHVSWSNMTELSRANYRWRMDGLNCFLQPCGRKIRFQIPEKAAGLTIQSPGDGFGDHWKVLGEKGDIAIVGTGELLSVGEKFGGIISVEAEGRIDSPVKNATRQPVAVALMRRLLTEGRDRFLS